MPAQWTADVIGQMHLLGITGKQLAAAAGWNPKYLSQVLNGRVTPKRAEEKLKDALNTIIAQRNDISNDK